MQARWSKVACCDGKIDPTREFSNTTNGSWRILQVLPNTSGTKTKFTRLRTDLELYYSTLSRKRVNFLFRFLVGRI